MSKQSSTGVQPTDLLNSTSTGTTKTRKRRSSSTLGGEPPMTNWPSLATQASSSELSKHANSSSTDRPQKGDKSKGRKRRKVKSWYRRWRSTSHRHTWLNPLILALTIVALYLANPSESNPVSSAIFLSYPIPRGLLQSKNEPLQYDKGFADLVFVGFYTIVLTFTREFVMQQMLRPLAIKAGMKTRGKQARFMEQAYTALYFGILGPLGLYVMKQTPVWYFDTNGMYESFPHRTHLAEVKTYYLFQAAYWAQQMIVLVLGQEKPRKDFKELIAHHIITISLIYLSYAFHFTYMGLAVYTTHDISDFFLATSKILNYLDSPIVIPYFVIFLFSWAYLRHFINLKILFSLLPLPMPFPDHINAQILDALSSVSTAISSATAPITPILAPFTNFFATLFPESTGLISHLPEKLTTFFNTPSDFASIGPYELNWVTQQYKCWISQYITFGLLFALQLVNMFWFYLILRILWRLLISMGQEVEDVRSEDSEEAAQDRQDTLDELRKEQGDSFAGETGADIGRLAQKPELLLNGVPVDKA